MLEFIIISLIKAAVVAFVLHDHAGVSAMGGAQSDRARPGAPGSVARGPARAAAAAGGRDQADHKEDLIPPYVNKFFYLLAPFLAVPWRCFRFR